MDLNWTAEFIVNITIAFVLFIALGVLANIFKTKKVPTIKYFGFAWVFIAFFFLLEALSTLFLSVFLGRIAGLMFFPGTIFLVIAIDFTMSESINITKMSITCSIGGCLLCFLFSTNSIELSKLMNQNSIVLTGFIENLFYMMVLLWFIIVAFHFSIITFLRAPNQIKKDAKFFLMSTILMGPFSIFFYSIGFIFSGFIFISKFIILIGGIFFLYSLIRKPKILYILPFEAFKLMVIYRHSGISLFHHEWSREHRFDDFLLSGLLHAFHSMSGDIIQRGNLSEIILENGVLIFQITDHTIVGIIATNASKILREGLKEFSKEFEQKYKKYLLETPNETSNFYSATELIKKHFENIPYRI